jgi:putative hydrolase of the HAD superfamily
MNAPKRKSLMIGDSWDADILGARLFGMDQVYYCPLQGKQPDLQNEKSSSSGTTTTVITHLEQLLDIL